MKRVSKLIFSEQYGPTLLFLISTILLFGFLGSKTLWTMENRWASIVSNMLVTHDYLHPYLAQHDYYDKPLLSYWLMVPFAKLFGVNTWSLRLPSAFAGGLTLWCMYQLANNFWGKKTALYAGWMLLTSLGFLFWAHVASADILNIAGMMLALLIYQKNKTAPKFKSFLLFFIVLFLTALCKGVEIIALMGIVLIPDIIYQKQYKHYFSAKFLLALLMGILIYLTPFWLSQHFNQVAYQESGLIEVFRENILRFFAPFDHEGKWYIYFYFLPYYLFPWVFFLIPALISGVRQAINKVTHRPVSGPDRWVTWPVCWVYLMTGLLFLFFCLSQSRRSYYILPVLPFAILVTSAWLTQSNIKQKWRCFAAGLANIFVVLSLLVYLVLTPVYYSSGGQIEMGEKAKDAASRISPWENWQVIALNAEMEDVVSMQTKSRIYIYDGDQSIVQELDRSKALENKFIIYVVPRETYHQYEDYFLGYPVIVSTNYYGKKILSKAESNNPMVAVLVY